MQYQYFAFGVLVMPTHLWWNRWRQLSQPIWQSSNSLARTWRYHFIGSCSSILWSSWHHPELERIASYSINFVHANGHSISRIFYFKDNNLHLSLSRGDFLQNGTGFFHTFMSSKSYGRLLVNCLIDIINGKLRHRYAQNRLWNRLTEGYIRRWMD